MTQPFLFEPGLWIGEGHVQFSSSPEQVKFYTRWKIPKIIEKKKQGKDD